MSASIDAGGQFKTPEQSNAYSSFAYSLLAFFVLAIFLATGLSAKKDLDNELAINIKRAEDNALIYEDQIVQTFQLIENVARTLQFTTDRQLDQLTPDDLRLILQRAQFSLPAIRSMSLVDDGQNVFASSSRGNLGLKIDLTLFQPINSDGRNTTLFRISQPWRGRDLSSGTPSSLDEPVSVNDAYFIPVLLRLNSSNNKSDGFWILVAVNPDYLLSRLSRYNNEKTDSFDLITTDGRVLLSDHESLPGERFGEFHLLSSILKAKKSTNLEKNLLAFRVSDRYPIFIITRIERQEIIRLWLEKKLPFFCWIIAATGAGVLIFWILLSRINNAEKNHLKQQRVVYRLSQALAQSPSGILITNLKGIVEYCNLCYCQMVEKSASDIIGTVTFMFDSNLIPASATIDIIDGLKAGQIWKGEFAHANSSESATREVQVIWSPLRDEGNEITHFICVEHDISQLKKMQHELSISRDRAETATRAKSEFLANISHEIRTPMSGVIGMTHLALEEDMGEKAKEYVTHARTSAVTLLGILNDILDFSKMEAGKLQLEAFRFDFKAWLDGIVKPHAMAAKDKGLQFECNVSTEVPNWITSDSLRLSQILNNLIGNAIKFTTLGKVDLSVRFIQKLENSKSIEKEYFLEFNVSDTGCGMTSSEIDSLFKPFTQANYSTSRVYGGTGLGLVICKRLCLAFNGDITVSSQPQVGSSFVAKVSVLPADPPELEFSIVPSLSSVTSRATRDLNGLKVLLVEDYPFNRQMMVVLLGKFGLNVDVAVNGQDALDRLHSPDSHYDVVLMDIQMPIMDGITATQHIRRETIFDNLPIIAVTANAMRDEQEICLQAGMQEYLVKPIDRTALFDSLVTWAGREKVIYNRS